MPEPRVVHLAERSGLRLDAEVDLSGAVASVRYLASDGSRASEVDRADAAILVAALRPPRDASGPAPHNADPLLTSREAREYLRISERTFYRLLPRIRHLRLVGGGGIRIPASALDAYLTAQQREPETWAPVATDTAPAPTRRRTKAPRVPTATADFRAAVASFARPIVPRTKPRNRT